jgi:hypothetical protein
MQRTLHKIIFLAGPHNNEMENVFNIHLFFIRHHVNALQQYVVDRNVYYDYSIQQKIMPYTSNLYE